MRILFITHKFYPEIGGIEVNSEILAQAFHEQGHEVKVLTWTAEPGSKTFDYEVIRHPNYAALFKLHSWAQVVYENNPTLRLSFPAILLGKPRVVALRTWVTRIEGTIGWQDKLKLWWLAKASAVIAVSEAVRKKSWPKAIVIGNPYRSNLFRVIPGVSREKGFAFLGRLVSDKGADHAIKAFAEVLKTYKNLNKDYSLTIIGNGPDRNALEELVKELNLENKVVFTGSLQGDALVNCLNEHAYLLVPSVWEEPFGNVALEGMACGCLPIVSDGGGLPDAVGKAGLVFKRGDISALSQAMLQIINDPVLEAQLRSEADHHLKSHLPQHVAGLYLQVITNAAK